MRRTTVHHHMRHTDSGIVPVVQHTRHLDDLPTRKTYCKPKWAERQRQEDLLFGDYDNDGVRNSDDVAPFNNKKKEIKFDGSHSKFGGGEVKLSDELLKLQEENNFRKEILDKFKNENIGSMGRIKTVPSTMKKLRERYLNELGDVGGAMILVKNREEANKIAEQIKNKYPHEKDRTDNFYGNPKGGVYYAHHIGLYDPKNPKIRLEVQVTSEKMHELNVQMHEDYKNGADLTKYKEKAKKLYDEGY